MWTRFFVVKSVVEKYLEKDRKLFAVFIAFEKEYDRVDKRALWNVFICKICDVGGLLLDRIKAFYENTIACVRAGSELSE